MSLLPGTSAAGCASQGGKPVGRDLHRVSLPDNASASAAIETIEGRWAEKERLFHKRWVPLAPLVAASVIAT